jgi:hypothetical protein
MISTNLLCLCAFLWLNFLRQDRGLAPANCLLSRESVLMHDPEVSLRFILHFARRMALEPEQYLEKHAD